VNDTFTNKKVLIVDDEEQMRELLRAYLEKTELYVEEASDGLEALKKIKSEHFDLVILDVMMPEMDGLSACIEIRKFSQVPIIMLTARSEELDRVHGLEIGADDYLVKPFSPRELIARVKALLRRSQINNKVEEEFIKVGKLIINPKRRNVKLEHDEIPLTPKEYDLLLFLVNHPNQVWTREQLLEQVWGYDFYGSLRTVDTHIKTLRMKLGDFGTYIFTIWGIGYKFEVEA